MRLVLDISSLELIVQEDVNPIPIVIFNEDNSGGGEVVAMKSFVNGEDGLGIDEYILPSLSLYHTPAYDIFLEKPFIDYALLAALKYGQYVNIEIDMEGVGYIPMLDSTIMTLYIEQVLVRDEYFDEDENYYDPEYELRFKYGMPSYLSFDRSRAFGKLIMLGNSNVQNSTYSPLYYKKYGAGTPSMRVVGDIDILGMPILAAITEWNGKQLKILEGNSSTIDILATGYIVANRFVSADSEHANIGDKAIGISLSSAAEGEVCQVQTMGIGLVECGGTIAAGDEVKPTAQGKAILSSTACQGMIALDSGGNGAIIRVKL